MNCLVFGGSGLLGSELVPQLKAEGAVVFAPGKDQVDCRNAQQVHECLKQVRPDVVILAAARVGGILANMRYASEYLYDNTLMNLVTLKACAEQRVKRVLLFGSSCMYPRGIERPILEEDLLTGPLEPTNEGYAIGKIAAVKYAQALRREGRVRVTVCIPTNLYGQNDRFDEGGHLIPALIVKMHRASEERHPRLELWGDGSARRDFLHASDAARACLTILNHDNPPEMVNIGSGTDWTVREIAQRVAGVVGFQGEIVFTGAGSNGTPRKLLSTHWVSAQGWKPEFSLEEGLRRTYRHYCSMQPAGFPEILSQSGEDLR